MTENSQREIDVKGHIEVSDELCEDGSEALVFITEDNEEFVIRNRKVVKRLMKYAGGVQLLSNNPAYAPMMFTYDGTDEEPIRIIGKVVESRRKF